MRIALCCHVYYPEVFEVLAPQVERLAGRVELFLTCRDEVRGRVDAIVREHRLQPAAIDTCANRGMDVLPFLESVEKNALYDHDVVIKIHTKNPGLRGAAQLDLIADCLIGGEGVFSALEAAFAARPELVMAGPDLLYRSAEAFIYGNRPNIEFLQRLIHGESRELENGFFAGTAFWIRGHMLQPISGALDSIVAEDERQSVKVRSGADGSMAHALERFWGDLDTSYRGAARVGLVHRALDGDRPRFWVRTPLASEAQREISREVIPGQTTLRLQTMREDHAILKQAGKTVFSASHYRTRHGHLMPEGMKPLQHFVECGELLGLSPAAQFDVGYYRLANPRLSEDVNSAVHYVTQGREQGLIARPSRANWFDLAKQLGLFDGRWYRRHFPDVPGRVSSDSHYKRFGSRLNRPCSSAFDPRSLPQASALEHDPSKPSVVVQFISQHYYEEGRLYRLLANLIKLEDLVGAEALTHRIERVYGTTDNLLVARAFCLVRRNAWDEALEIMRDHWARRATGRARYRHFRQSVPEKRPDEVFVPVKPSFQPKGKARICVYTASFGERSELPPNKAIADGVDFICFTDRHVPTFGWQVRTVEPSFQDPNLAAKRYKVLPHVHLSEYDYSLFVDANTLLCGRLEEWIERYLMGRGFVMWTHPERSDLYREIFAIVETGRHRPDELFAQMRKYAEEGLPPRSGMVEASCIWRRHADTRVTSLMDRWWDEILAHSRRDQLSLGYLFWKEGVRPQVLRRSDSGADVGTSRSNPYFCKLPHGQPSVRPGPNPLAPITFLYAERFRDSGSTVMRGQQLSEMVAAHFPDREVSYESGKQYWGRILFLTKGYLAEATRQDLAMLKERGNFLLADYVDAKPPAKQVEFIDALVASSISALVEYRRLYPRKRSFHVTHHVDPRLEAGNRATDCQVGYIGERVNAMWTEALKDAVPCVQVDTSKRTEAWLQEVSRFSLHYAVRRVRRLDGHKPFLKGFTAAHCHANIVIQADSGDASYYLGPHYPYLLSAEPTEEEVLDVLKRARDGYGGPEWRRGLEVMAEVRARTSVPYIMSEFSNLLEQL